MRYAASPQCGACPHGNYRRRSRDRRNNRGIQRDRSHPVPRPPLPRRKPSCVAGMMAPLDSNEFMFASEYFDLQHNPGPFEAVTSFQAGTLACLEKSRHSN